jgi:hypothetical protein
MTKQILTLAIFIIFLEGCATLGTKTLYKSEARSEIKNIGFSNLDGNAIVSKIFPQTDSIFKKTFIETFKTYNLTDIIPLNIEFPIAKPNTSEIAQICKENNFDGFVISHLKFIHITYSAYFIPIAKTWDTEVEMKLFDNTGNLMLTVLHNTTKGNSYFMPPTADKTIRDGTQGAIRRIAKELRLTK